MNLKKIIASVAAAAVAVSTMAISSFATVTNETYYLVSDDGSVPVFSSADQIADVTSFTITFTSDVDLAAKVEAGEWCNFGVIFNSNSTGWDDSREASPQAGAKGMDVVATGNANEYKVEYKSSTPIFKSTDTYAQIWFQDWSNDKSGTYTVTSIVLYDSNGNVVTASGSTEAAAETEAAPAETESTETEVAKEEAPAETDAAPAEEVVEETVNEPAAVEETVSEPAAVEDAADATAAADTTVSTPAADSTTTAAKTGNTAAAVVVSVMAVAAAAAVVSKRK